MKATIPTCVGFIMDGNRRWAKAKGKPTVDGHQAGFAKFKEVTGWAGEVGIKHLVFYAFSSENWQRSEAEVASLLQLFLAAGKELHEAVKQGVKFQIIGDRAKFPSEVQSLINKFEETTKNNTELTVTVALSYGGRAEILAAANKVITAGIILESEADFAQYLWTKDMPDPDIIVRTGDALRLSNFLPWQSVYSELSFSKTLWPDFTHEEFKEILADYATRQRRLGV